MNHGAFLMGVALTLIVCTILLIAYQDRKGIK